MRKNGWLEPMHPVDSFWYSMDESTNLMVITALMEFNQRIPYHRLQTLLEKRLLIYKRFRQKIVWPVTRLGLPFWDYDANFDIQNHIIKVALPSPGDKKALARMIGDFMITPLDKEKPLWQVHLIENYDDGTVVLIRIHHAIADGIAMVRLLFSLADLQPADSPGRFLRRRPSSPNIMDILTPVEKKPKSKLEAIQETLNLLYRTGEVSVMKSLNLTEFMQKELMKTLAHPTYITQFARHTASLGLEFAAAMFKLAFMAEDKKTCLKGRISTQKGVFWTDPISLAKVKEIGKFYNCSINDVVLAAVTGALRNYCMARGNDLSDAESRFAVPVSVGHGSANVELGNKFSLVFLQLPLHLDDPVHRLRELRKRIRATRHSAEAYVGYQALKFLGIPPKRITKRGAGFFSKKLTGVLANVPGPTVPLYFEDLPVQNIMFWVPRIGNMGLGISIFSYMETVTIGIASDSRLVHDPADITRLIDDEFTQMHEIMKKNKQLNIVRKKQLNKINAEVDYTANEKPRSG